MLSWITKLPNEAVKHAPTTDVTVHFGPMFSDWAVGFGRYVAELPDTEENKRLVQFYDDMLRCVNHDTSVERFGYNTMWNAPQAELDPKPGEP